MSKRLKDKVAIITGSTVGLGEGFARQMAKEGAAVVVSGRQVEAGERVACEINESGGRAFFVRADVTCETDCINLIGTALRQFGRLDVLVNNAGIFPSVEIDEVTTELFDQVFAVNVRGPFLCSRAAIPPMKEQGGGAIINIGSTTAYTTISGMNRMVYGSSKGALLTMTKTMAKALLCDQIRVNWVTVGWIATPGEIALRDQTCGNGEAYLKEVARNAPMGRMETVEETAAGVIYLASDEASHVTGCELNISGGRWI